MYNDIKIKKLVKSIQLLFQAFIDSFIFEQKKLDRNIRVTGTSSSIEGTLHCKDLMKK